DVGVRLGVAYRSHSSCRRSGSLGSLRPATNAMARSRNRWNGRALLSARTMSERACTFCGKGAKDVRALIAGTPPLFICNECIELASDIIAEEGDEESPIRQGRPPWGRSAEARRVLGRTGAE